jgi:hypothetical protein
MRDGLETRIVSNIDHWKRSVGGTCKPSEKGNDMFVLLGAIGIMNFVQLHLVSKKAAYMWWRFLQQS